jgi:hypothetical protein
MAFAISDMRAEFMLASVVDGHQHSREAIIEAVNKTVAIFPFDYHFRDIQASIAGMLAEKASNK